MVWKKEHSKSSRRIENNEECLSGGSQILSWVYNIIIENDRKGKNIKKAKRR